VLLNIFQEHLDFFGSFEAYASAKYRITTYQKKSDTLIYWHDQKIISDKFTFNDDIRYYSYSLNDKSADCHVSGENVIWDNGIKLPLDIQRSIHGEHNLLNIIAAVSAVIAVNAFNDSTLPAVTTFRGLPHRLEYLGKVNGKFFYNDSIATIPEACIQALKTLGKVDTLILGGFDRGIDYTSLIGYLSCSVVMNLVFVGVAGRRMYQISEGYSNFASECVIAPDFDYAVKLAAEKTSQGGICLLSPAASSYDEFRNFEHRGDRFKKLING
jgi:UDP-N-acetylmuramoylalanine--D-glutamate ligase